MSGKQLHHDCWALGALLFSVVAGAQQCRPQLDLDASIADPALLGDLARGIRVELPFQVRLRADREPCPVALGVGAEPDPAVYAEVRVDPQGGVLSATAAGNSDERLLLDLDAGNWTSRTLWLALQSRTPLLTSGLLPIRLQVAAFEPLLATTALVEGTFEARIAVAPVIDVQVDTGTGWRSLDGAAEVLDLGELSDGARARAWLQIDSNVPARVELNSLGGGVLHHSARARYAMPYQLSINGHLLPDAKGDYVIDPAAGSQRLSVDVLVPPPKRIAAGEYSDVVQVSVIPE